MKKIAVILFPLLLSAGTVGKIAGRVIDAENSEPLIAVDVFITALRAGGATDAEGTPLTGKNLVTH